MTYAHLTDAGLQGEIDALTARIQALTNQRAELVREQERRGVDSLLKAVCEAQQVDPAFRLGVSLAKR